MSEYAPNTFTTGLYVAVLGDFKQGYMITDSQAISIKVLDQLYAETNQIGYRVSYYGDGAPVLEEAFARVKLG
jgi:HK97 family phage major capsid protein